MIPAKVLESVLTCPSCGAAEPLVMPEDACVFFHECAACHRLLRPNDGDCCVFCSFGSVPCPSMQGDASVGDGCCGDPVTRTRGPEAAP